MSEFGVRSPEALTDRVRETENEYEERMTESVLADTLFHTEFVDEVLLNSPEDRIRLLALEHEFLEEKRGKNMGERFELALSDKYLGKIHVVELGKTTNPGATGEIDGLKDDYRMFLRWMIEHDVVEKELDRSESKRTIRCRQPRIAEAAGQLVICERNRPLIRTNIIHDGARVDIAINKRMIFSLPAQTAVALKGRFQGDEIRDEQTLDFIESYFLHHGSGGVRPIRTAYYLATKLNTPETD
jgi:hypothetical protein